MRLDIKKNTKRNVLYGFISQVTIVLLPFIVRSIFIRTLGKDYVGLSSLFTSILSVLSLAELGIGSAMIYFMYQPLANDDYEQIGRLLNLYKKIYRIIGIIILIIGVALLPFIRYFVHGSYPSDINIYTIYLIELGGTLLTYFLFAYKNSVLILYQRNDVVSIVTLLTKIICCGFQIVSLLLFRNYYVYITIVPFTNLIYNISICIIVDKKYPELKTSGYPEKSIYKQLRRKVSGLSLIKVGYVVNNTVDNIVISSFLGLGVLGVYSNYYYIITTVYGFITIIYNSVRSGLGNYVSLHTKDESYELFKKMVFIQHWLIILCTICFLCLYQPFIKLWAGEDMMLEDSMVILFCVYFITLRCCDVISLFKDAVGQWSEDKFRPLICAGVNLVLNIILVQYIGLYGILLSTIISQVLIGLPWIAYSIYKYYFEHNFLIFILYCIRTFLVAFVIGFGTLKLCEFVSCSGVLEIIIRLGICLIVPNLCLLIIYGWTKEFKKSLKLGLGFFKRKVR